MNHSEKSDLELSVIYEFVAAIVFTIIYLILYTIALLKNESNYLNTFSILITLLGYLGLALCIVIFDTISTYKFIRFKKHNKTTNLINQRLEKHLHYTSLILGACGILFLAFS